MANIETGADRLVDLINREKRVSVEDAAKKLGISKIVIQEWADFLEEEGIISIEYKFSKTFLVERKLSKDEVKVKEKEYSSERDAFVRKVESSLKNLEQDSLGLQKIKSEFDLLKRNIGDEIKKVKEEVEQLEKYEYLKKNLDKDIEKQASDFHDILDKAHLQIENEQKKHQELFEALEIEKRELQVKEHRLMSIEEKEKEMMQRIQEIFELSKQLERTISGERSSVTASENRIVELRNAVKDVESNILNKRKSIQPLLDEAKKHEEQILKLQQDILSKAKTKTDAIKSQVQEGGKVVSNFERFFNRKAEVESLINEVEKERVELEQNLINLKKKAIAFNLASKTSNVLVHVKELEGEMERANKERGKFRENLEKLIKLIKG